MQKKDLTQRRTNSVEAISVKRILTGVVVGNFVLAVISLAVLYS